MILIIDNYQLDTHCFLLAGKSGKSRLSQPSYHLFFISINLGFILLFDQSIVTKESSGNRNKSGKKSGSKSKL